MQKASLEGADWRLAQDKAVFTAAAIKIQLMSRAKKARARVEARKKATQQVEQALNVRDGLAAQFEVQGMEAQMAQHASDLKRRAEVVADIRTEEVAAAASAAQGGR